MTEDPWSGNLSMIVLSTVTASPTLLRASGTPDESTMKPRFAGVTTSRL